MRLYRDLASQDEIDRAYNPSATVPDAARRMAAWTERSVATRAKLDGRLGVAYGPTRAEHLDVFPAGDGAAPVHVFVHGGYWRRFAAADFSFVAKPIVAAGSSAVVVNYALCPTVTLGEIVRQVRAAIAWTYRNAASFGGDNRRLTLSGHSAGGHLAAMATFGTDWPGDYDLPPDVIKRALCVSGLYDLGPFPYSWLQPSLQLTWDEVRRLSPINLVPDRGGPPVELAVGGLESAEFHRQADAYAALLRDRGIKVSFRDVEGRDHFTVLDELAARPGGGLTAPTAPS